MYKQEKCSPFVKHKRGTTAVGIQGMEEYTSGRIRRELL
jgi:hypothetical protein